MQLRSKILLPDCKTSRCSPTQLHVQFSSFLFLRILKCRNLLFSSVKQPDLKQMKNSVLNISLCAKTETFKTLTTAERFKFEGNSFYLRFYHSNAASNVWCSIDAYSRQYFNMGTRQWISYNLCQKQKYNSCYVTTCGSFSECSFLFFQYYSTREITLLH